MNLVIDIGNTQIKIAVFEDQNLIFKNAFNIDDIQSNLESLSTRYKINRVILSHVARLQPEVLHYLKAQFDTLVLDSHTAVPFINKYETPQTLGVDRLALVAAAASQFKNKNVLVIDAGSCITYDFINSRSEYLGGSISPGIEMRYKAVHHFTANLPILTRAEEIPAKGNSTNNAIHLGILEGVVLEINGIIERHIRQNQKLTVVLTGGDTIFLAKNLKSSIFAIPNFLLEGLNSILIHNIDE